MAGRIYRRPGESLFSFRLALFWVRSPGAISQFPGDSQAWDSGNMTISLIFAGPELGSPAGAIPRISRR